MLMHEKIERGRRRAEAALAAYRAEYGGAADSDDASAIRDLIEDLLHLAEARGVLPSEIEAWVEYAVVDYQHEADPDNADEVV